VLHKAQNIAKVTLRLVIHYNGNTHTHNPQLYWWWW